jgi:hypothetical protein
MSSCASTSRTSQTLSRFAANLVWKFRAARPSFRKFRLMLKFSLRVSHLFIVALRSRILDLRIMPRHFNATERKLLSNATRRLYIALEPCMMTPIASAVLCLTSSVSLDTSSWSHALPTALPTRSLHHLSKAARPFAWPRYVPDAYPFDLHGARCRGCVERGSCRNAQLHRTHSYSSQSTASASPRHSPRQLS